MTHDRLVRARAVLDERERLATAACGLSGPMWRALRDGVCEAGNLYGGWVIQPGGYTTAGEAQHIAASSPATVLREVAGWRAALDLHEHAPWVEESDNGTRVDHGPYCRTCGHTVTALCPTVEAALTALGVTS